MNNKNVTISVVSPVFQAQDIIVDLVKKLSQALEELTVNYEIILVDDRSPDNSWRVIETLCREKHYVKGIRLSKNTGQQKAIFAGMQASSGEHLIITDCDLQEGPEYVKELYHKFNQGFDVVLTKWKTRSFSKARNVITRLFYGILNSLTDSELSFYNTGTLSIIDRKVAEAMLKVNSKNWFYLPVLSQVGFEHTFIEVEHARRLSGKSSYTFKKLYSHGVNLILGNSNKLLNLSIGIGLTFVALALIWATYLITIFILGSPPNGYTSIMVTLLLCTGILLLSIGVTGLYIGKIFEQTKNNPDFFIDEVLNIKG